MRKQFGIYIHIPFCRQKCFYCDFPSFAGRESRIDSYLTALEQELLLGKNKLLEQSAGEEICDGNGRLLPATIYIGGGTPTVLSEEQLKKLLSAVQRHIAVEAAWEFTVEANPGTLNSEKLRLLRAAGANRLSIGVQSFDDSCLKAIGRVHNAGEAAAAVELADKLGFGNISLDLIYGLPYQPLSKLQESVQTALSLPIRHISVYGLQIEEGTAFASMAKMGKLHLPDDDAVEKMYDYIAEALPQSGYLRYEISNYSQKGYESRHNLSYWQDVDYLGFGSGAHGYWQGIRYENPRNIDKYMEIVQSGALPAAVEERLDRKSHIEEFCFLGLRTAEGLDDKTFRQKFGAGLREVYGNVLDSLVDKGLLKSTNRGIALTDLGMKYGNQVFGEFLL